MFLQRLIIDEVDKAPTFSYDDMNHRRYEMGATVNGRAGIAQAFIDKDIAVLQTKMLEHRGTTPGWPIDVVVMARQATIAKIGNLYHIRGTCPLLTDQEHVVGWLLVGNSGEMWGKAILRDPLFILRKNVDRQQERVNNFFNPIIEKLKTLPNLTEVRR